jgi:two-component system alkaline phosphatase synthesis response regulator PhoP
VLKGGLEVPLTRKEFEILVLLIKRAGEVITRDEFLNNLWGEDVHVTHRTVDTHVATLRKKLEADPNAPIYFVGVRGVGYRFNEGLLKT